MTVILIYYTCAGPTSCKMISVKFAAFLLATSSFLFSQDKPGTTLYERIGRYDAIASVVDDYLKGIRSDPQFARFAGRSTDSLVRARQLLKDQLCAMTGGPCVYVGRDMATAHGGLAITDADVVAAGEYMEADRQGIQAASRK